jgi:flagellar protein FlgJ
MIKAVNSSPPSDRAEKRAELAKAAQAFEAVFLRQMIGSMRQAHLAEDMLGSRATEQFRDMSDARLADAMAANGKGLGIAQMLLDRFDRQGEAK